VIGLALRLALFVREDLVPELVERAALRCARTDYGMRQRLLVALAEIHGARLEFRE
jgi:hypothetical protein